MNETLVCDHSNEQYVRVVLFVFPYLWNFKKNGALTLLGVKG